MSQAVKRRRFVDLSDLPPLPAKVVTRQGQEIETAGSVWKKRSSAGESSFHLINWSITSEQSGSRGVLSTRAWYLVKLYLANRLPRRDSQTIRADYYAFLAFDHWLGKQDTSLWLDHPEQSFDWVDYGEALARAFLRYGIDHTPGQGRQFSQIRAFYAWGVAHQFPDFSLACLHILRSIRAVGNLKGRHVLFRDTTHGPFSTDEQRAIQLALAGKDGLLLDRIIVRLHYELGINPHAATLLKNKDLHWYEAQGSRYYQLDVPRIKKRLPGRATKRRPISSVLGSLLLEIQQGTSDDALLFWLPEGKPEKAIRYAMTRFAKMSKLVSPRTNKPLELHPRRFRYTLATHLAEEGAPDLYIAEVLDHSNLLSVAVYRQTTSLIARPVAQATDPMLMPLVRRFLGIIVESEQAQVFAGLPHQIVPGAPLHIPQVPLDIGGVGFCGRNLQKDGLCKLYPPLSCYSCSFFAALRTGPHQQLLEGLEAYLEAQRDRLDQRILLQLEEVLCAIREVLAQLTDPEGHHERGPHEQ